MTTAFSIRSFSNFNDFEVDAHNGPSQVNLLLLLYTKSGQHEKPERINLLIRKSAEGLFKISSTIRLLLS